MVANVGKPTDILLVEDSAADADLVRRAFSRGNIKAPLHHVVDGVEAMAFLRREGAYINAPRPTLILLDLNLPRMDGKDVLREIGKDESLQLIPVVIFTTSKHEQDVLDAYQLKTNAYIVKPVDVQQYFAAVQQTYDFWLRLVQLPG